MPACRWNLIKPSLFYRTEKPISRRATHMKIIHIHHGKENYRTVMTAGNHELIADEPESLGGGEKGPDPYDYLLMSLGSCTVITLKMYADRKKWPVEDIYVELRHFKSHAKDCRERSEEHTSELQSRGH